MKKIYMSFFALLVTLGALLIFAPLPTMAASNSLGAVSGKNTGTVDVSWFDDRTSSSYDLIYGTAPNQLMFGQTSMSFTAGTNNTVTVGNLNPGTTYYFQLVGQTGGSPNRSGPVTAKASGRSAKKAKVLGTSTASTVSKNKVASVSTSSGPVGPYSFSAATRPTLGTVELSWTDKGDSTQYDLVYGFAPGQYQFGVVGVPFSQNSRNTFTVGSLAKGQRYYFALVAQGSWITSAPISAVAR